MGLFSALGEDFELSEKDSEKRIEIKREELIKIVHAVRFYRDFEANAFEVLKYDDIYRKLDRALD